MLFSYWAYKWILWGTGENLHTQNMYFQSNFLKESPNMDILDFSLMLFLSSSAVRLINANLCVFFPTSRLWPSKWENGHTLTVRGWSSPHHTCLQYSRHQFSISHQTVEDRKCHKKKKKNDHLHSRGDHRFWVVNLSGLLRSSKGKARRSFAHSPPADKSVTCVVQIERHVH